ncbi:MAG: dodecin domain-containing protein [Christiangramia sp.]
MSIMKVIEVIATSDRSFETTTENVVQKLSKQLEISNLFT